MKIVFDSRWIKEKSSGIGVYAREMMRRLPALMPDSEFVFLFQSQAAAEMALGEGAAAALGGATSCKIVPFGPMSAKNQLFMPKLLREMGADIFHSPNYMIPYTAFGHCQPPLAVVNIHDVIPLVVENYAPKSRTSRMKFIYKFCLRQTVKHAAMVITGSESAKKDLSQTLNLPWRLSEKIHVIYDGADGGNAQPAPVAFDSDSARPRRLLYVGRMDPYKNVAGLVRAFADAEKRVPFPLKLTIVGATDPRYPEARDEAERLGVANHVDFADHVPDAELARLYCESDLLTHFSSYEGFGLPIVEAMRSGLPVICTNGGSQPEVAGGAAEIIKAGDELSMAGAIADLLCAPAKMLDMRAAGLERAKTFTWSKCAAETAKQLSGISTPPAK